MGVPPVVGNARPAGVARAWANGQRRLHGNLGDPDVSTDTIPGWSSRVNKLQARRNERPRRRRERKRGRGLTWYRGPKATKESETDIRESQRLDSTEEPGERPS